ncbi:MAG: superoxide dismutase [Ni] [Planctomycetota bacterium]
MLRVLPLFAVFAAVLPAADTAFAHCQVPCGIYGDQRVFEELLEHHATITKATLQIGELTGKMSGGPDAQDVNQLTRWVSNKESHAQLVQERMLNYFLAQRIKADKPNYVEQLKTAQAVIVAAMK